MKQALKVRNEVFWEQEINIVVVAVRYDALALCCELQIPQQIGFYEVNLHVCNAYVFNNMQFACEKYSTIFANDKIFKI
jgi:hypothetical protein